MKKRFLQIFSAYLSILFGTAGVLFAESVKLTNTSGREIQAELIALDGDEVKIRVRARGSFNLKLDSLSEESRQLVLEKLTPKEETESPGVLVRAEKLVIDDPLNKKTWEENWRGGKGNFHAEVDRVVGVEDPSENHSAGAGRRQEMTSAIIQVEFRYDESTQMGLLVDFKGDTSNKYDNQHVIKLQIKDGKLSLWSGKGWSDQTRRNQLGKPKDVKVLEGWNTVTLEFHGEEMVGHLNGEAVTGGTAGEAILAPKNQITLSANGTVSFRNLKMWDGGEVHPEWEKKRRRLAR